MPPGFNSRLREEATFLYAFLVALRAVVSTHASVRRRPHSRAATYPATRFNSRLREEATKGEEFVTSL